ncbi:MAG: homoserine dehydrogenase [Verrucomicrobia bacterium]|nr:homoserine dehydrogenase [Verrucomicrobiota bacterium]
MQEFGIGVLGYGTVGAGVVEGLLKNGDLIADRTGLKPVLRRIADLDIETDRGVDVPAELLCTDANAVIEDEHVDMIVELIGGTGIAKTLTEAALKRGKPVITANKALLAKHGAELFELARRHSTEIYFGASVGGGIPVIRAVREGLVANRIEWIYGILNGTCNYVLTRMENEQLPFDEVLADAQKQGFAEKDPSLDVDGHDTAHKAVLLASLAYGFHVPLDKVSVSGIRDLSIMDIRNASDLGYKVKLLAIIRRVEDSVEVSVHPAFLPRGHILSNVSGVFNAVMVHGDMTGDTLYYGKGAGRKATASSVLADICDVMKNLHAGSPRQFQGHGSLSDHALSLANAADISTRHYIRLALLDQPNSLSHIAASLGRNGISIASVVQKESQMNDFVWVVIVTHHATQRQCAQALSEITAMDAVRDKPIHIRIEDS